MKVGTRKKVARAIVATAMAAMLAVAAPFAAARTRVKPGFNLVSPNQEVQLGREAAMQVERQVPIERNARYNSMVNRIGRRLVAQAPGLNYPYTFKVVRDKRINAFALPGGPIYINSGTIDAAANEDQLAGVMAHEIAHVALRHGTNQASKAMLAQMPLAVLGGALGGGGSILGQLAQLGIGFGVQSVFLKYSRDAERQADVLGVQMMYDAGYNPNEMARFFEKMNSSERGRSIEFLSSHPNPGNRSQLVRNEIGQLGARR